jgi:hypothetical protein
MIEAYTTDNLALRRAFPGIFLGTPQHLTVSETFPLEIRALAPSGHARRRLPRSS